jgi:hypothetical protein
MAMSLRPLFRQRQSDQEANQDSLVVRRKFGAVDAEVLDSSQKAPNIGASSSRTFLVTSRDDRERRLWPGARSFLTHSADEPV